MKIMEKNNNFLNKVIAVLYWENNSDMYIKRYMELINPNHNHSKVLEDHGEKVIPGQHMTTESMTSDDPAPPKILAPLAT